MTCLDESPGQLACDAPIVDTQVSLSGLKTDSQPSL